MKLSKAAVLIFAFLVALILITLLTHYYGSTDTGDYATIAKYFSGDYKADARGSHSYFFGYMHSQLVGLTQSFIVFKISSLIFLALIIFSVYIISGKNKKTLLLMAFSPIIWYMAPWINPIQMASLCLLWSYYFISKYDKEDKLKFLAYSGILIGIGWAVWDSILFLGFFLIASFMFNKKLSHLCCLILFILIGLSPRLIIDSVFFKFPFYTILKSFFGTASMIFGGGIYDRATGRSPITILSIILILLIIPIRFWSNYKKSFLKNKAMIFLTLSLLMFLVTPQLRYFLAIIPIMILLSSNMNKKQFRLQMAIYIVMTLIFVLPYALQTSYSINNQENADIVYIIENSFNINLNEKFSSDIMIEDLNKISNDYPNEAFIIGNNPDDYQLLAYYYWGDKISEFVSIQDYQMHLKNQTSLFEKEIKFIPSIQDRRQIWIGGGIEKSQNDNTDYQSIQYAIGIGKPAELENFKLINQYTLLYVSEKST